jgi:hypothetical protein
MCEVIIVQLFCTAVKRAILLWRKRVYIAILKRSAQEVVRLTKGFEMEDCEQLRISHNEEVCVIQVYCAWNGRV